MSRRNRAVKREVLPDPKYKSVILAKFINVVMKSGKKAVAEKIVYDALLTIKEKQKADEIDFFEKSLSDLTPLVEVRSRRVGGSTYQVPSEVSTIRGQVLAMRWLVKAARSRGEKSMALRVAGELTDASEKKGSAYRKKEETHKMAEANKAFSHFRW